MASMPRVVCDYGNHTGEGAVRHPDEGIPDGMTVDEDGGLWSARWDGGCLVRYEPDGTEVQRVDFPVRKVSAVTVGGPDYETAYVTTALGPADGPKFAKEGGRRRGRALSGRPRCRRHPRVPVAGRPRLSGRRSPGVRLSVIPSR